MQIREANKIDDQQRDAIVQILQSGGQLPNDFKHVLFPPDRQEYELVYAGKEREEDIIAAAMAVPLQIVSTFGTPSDGWSNKLIFGDNLQALATLVRQKRDGSLVNAQGVPGVQLIYIDPPFATKRDFKGTQDQKAYQDRVVGAQFLEFMRKRLILLRELLSPTGSIFVHLDSKKGHYIKVLMDEIFGEQNFVNEIVWHYRKWSTNTPAFQKNHDTIFWYARQAGNPKRPFQIVAYEPPSPGTLKRWKGKKQQASFGETGVRTATNTDEKSMGAPISDVWNGPPPADEGNLDDVLEVSIINPAAIERKEVRYPTQKPEALLERIISAVSREGDLVLDAFAGSGTTCAVAEKLGRRWVGIDSGKLAVYTTQKRMLNLRREIGNRGSKLSPRAFTLYNAGLYDFRTLKALPWDDWRFFALQLFGCREEKHTVGGLTFDGKLKGASVLVFNHTVQSGKRVDEQTIQEIHAAAGKSIGTRVFVIAPRGVFDFQQDYLDIENTRYFALRIPYSMIHEIHSRSFSALRQPADEAEINATIDSVGFDFIQPPEVNWKKLTNGGRDAFAIEFFKSRAHAGGTPKPGMGDLSMVLLDYSFDGSVFNFDRVYFAEELAANRYEVCMPDSWSGRAMAVVLDVYGNESRTIFEKDVSSC